MNRRLSDIKTYAGLKVTIMGLGSFGGGVAAARFLFQRGANVTITDLRSEHQLADSVAQLTDCQPLRCFLGGHPDEAFTDADLIVLNPAVKPGNEIIARAQADGVLVTSEIELFLQHNAGRIIGVTGSNGKSTTTALIHHLLSTHFSGEAASHMLQTPRVFLGGNIGHSLLPEVDRIQSTDVVVLELSSFQLHALLAAEFSPEIAVVTNFSPNHLDWHKTVDHYRNAKQVLLRRQRPSGVAVVPDDDEANGPGQWPVRGARLRFGLKDCGEDGAYIEDGVLILRHRDREDAVRLRVPPQLPGEHNLLNIAAGTCAAWVAGANPESFSQSLATFQSLPHRLQFVAERRGIRFYNDSIATTPESAIAGLKTFRQPIILLAGGADKGIPLDEFAAAIHSIAQGVVLMGETAATLNDLLSQRSDFSTKPKVAMATNFPDAFSRAVALANPGSIVLLSPGCASYGWFKDFRDRGDQFAQLVMNW